MAIDANKQKTGEIAAIHKKFKQDIADVQTKADLLSGQLQINTVNVKGKKVPAVKKVEINKNLNRFIEFMETNYKSSMLKVTLKKKV